jgi:hypothetical protein
MTQFYSLIQALDYHRCCPLCESRLLVDESEFAERLEYPDGHPYQRYAFRLDYKSSDILYVNPYTNEVELKLVRDTYTSPTYGDSTAYIGKTPSYKSYNGVLYMGLTSSCPKCCQFTYTLKLLINLNERRLEATFLNSETVSLDDKGVTHEIRNVYSTGHTEYFYTKEDSRKEMAITLPLIPLDLNNPKKTLERIRTLLIFS